MKLLESFEKPRISSILSVFLNSLYNLSTASSREAHDIIKIEMMRTKLLNYQNIWNSEYSAPKDTEYYITEILLETINTTVLRLFQESLEALQYSVDFSKEKITKYYFAKFKKSICMLISKLMLTNIAKNYNIHDRFQNFASYYYSRNAYYSDKSFEDTLRFFKYIMISNKSTLGKKLISHRDDPIKNFNSLYSDSKELENIVIPKIVNTPKVFDILAINPQRFYNPEYAKFIDNPLDCELEFYMLQNYLLYNFKNNEKFKIYDTPNKDNSYEVRFSSIMLRETPLDRLFEFKNRFHASGTNDEVHNLLKTVFLKHFDNLSFNLNKNDRTFLFAKNRSLMNRKLIEMSSLILTILTNPGKIFRFAEKERQKTVYSIFCNIILRTIFENISNQVPNDKNVFDLINIIPSVYNIPINAVQLKNIFLDTIQSTS